MCILAAYFNQSVQLVSYLWHTGRVTENRSKSTTSDDPKTKPGDNHSVRKDVDVAVTDKKTLEKEIGGREGPDPTRYGDWEKAGRCIDF